MIVSEKDAINRLESPGNLINRLRGGTSRRDAMGLFGVASQHDIKPMNGNGSIGQIAVSSNSAKLEIPAFVNPFDKNTSSIKTALVPTMANLAKQMELPTKTEPAIPGLDNLLDNADSRIKLSLAHDRALDTLVDAVGMMKLKLDDIKPDKLPAVITATSKVVDQIQRQRIESNKNRDGREVHFHFYTPERKKVEDYQVIEVG